MQRKYLWRFFFLGVSYIAFSGGLFFALTTPREDLVNQLPNSESTSPEKAPPKIQNPLKQFQISSVNSEFPGNRERITDFSIPILMYHHILSDADGTDNSNDPSLRVSPETFDMQMQWLSDNGFETVSPDYFLTPHKTEKKPIIITFDDGYQNMFDNAVPILLKHGFVGTFYIVTDKAETPGYLTWEEMKWMQEVNMTIGSHTASHIALSIASDDSVRIQLNTSKKILEEKLGIPILHLAYPFGKFKKSDEHIAQETGYATAVNTKLGLNTKKTNLYALKRIAIRNQTDFSTLPQLNKNELLSPR